MTEEKINGVIAAAKRNNDASERIVEGVVTFNQVWFSLVAPILIGIFTAVIFSSKKLEGLPFIMWIVMGVVVVLVHLFLVWVNVKYSSKVSLYTDVVELKNEKETEIESLRRQLAKEKHLVRIMSNIYTNQISSVYLTSFATDMAVGQLKQLYLNKEILSENEIWNMATEAIGLMLTPLVMEREALFEFESGSKYNVALYFYDSDEEQLHVVWRDCDSRLPKRNRNWKPGHGHVGLAFLHKEPKISPDITTSDELAPSYDESDSSNYRSFISIPILNCDDNGELDNGQLPLGVLVLTSATKAQFRADRDLKFLTIITKNLAIYLASLESYLAHNDVKDA